MPRVSSKKKVDTVIAKDLTGKKPIKKKVDRVRYARPENVKKLEAKGWKVVNEEKDKHGRKLGVRTTTSDLILMEH